MKCGLVQLLFVILLFIHVDSNEKQLDPIKPSSGHKPHNKVNRVTREYVKKQIKRELSGRGRLAGLCSTICSGRDGLSGKDGVKELAAIKSKLANLTREVELLKNQPKATPLDQSKL